MTSFSLTNTLPQALLTAILVPVGQPLTAQLPAPGGVEWLKYNTPVNSTGGTFTYAAVATVNSGQGDLAVALYTPSGFYWKTGVGHGHPPVAQVSWGTAGSNVTFYFEVFGSPGLTYSFAVIVPPT